MATGPRYKVPFRRRRENRTDYYVRRKLLASGETRAVIRRSSNHITVQFADFGMNGDSVVMSASSKELKAMGWGHACSNIPAAYLTGYLAGRKAKETGLEYAVLDLGMQTPAKGAVLFAAVAGMLDSGLQIPHGDGVLPSEERLAGKHLAKDVSKDIEKVKKKIDGGKTPEPAEKKKPAVAKAQAAEEKKAADKAKKPEAGKAKKKKEAE